VLPTVGPGLQTGPGGSEDPPLRQPKRSPAHDLTYRSGQSDSSACPGAWSPEPEARSPESRASECPEADMSLRETRSARPQRAGRRNARARVARLTRVQGFAPDMSTSGGVEKPTRCDQASGPGLRALGLMILHIGVDGRAQRPLRAGHVAPRNPLRSTTACRPTQRPGSRRPSDAHPSSDCPVARAATAAKRRRGLTGRQYRTPDGYLKSRARRPARRRLPEWRFWPRPGTMPARRGAAAQHRKPPRIRSEPSAACGLPSTRPRLLNRLSVVAAARHRVKTALAGAGTHSGLPGSAVGPADPVSSVRVGRAERSRRPPGQPA
jgi:hypothetical protein